MSGELLVGALIIVGVALYYAVVLGAMRRVRVGWERDYVARTPVRREVTSRLRLQYSLGHVACAMVFVAVAGVLGVPKGVVAFVAMLFAAMAWLYASGRFDVGLARWEGPWWRDCLGVLALAVGLALVLAGFPSLTAAASGG